MAATASAVVSVALAIPRITATHYASSVVEKAQTGDPEAMYQAGILYSSTQDTKAFFWLELAAKAGNRAAFAASMHAAETLTPSDIEYIRQEEARWLQCHSNTTQACPGLPDKPRHTSKYAWMFSNPPDNRKASPAS